MAGLTVNIVTSKNRAFPDWPRPYMPSESWPYYGSHFYAQPNTNNVMLPGFLNFGSVGSSISINAYDSNNALLQHNGQGTQITSGSWNNGFAIGDGAAAYDQWSAFYMDRVDNLLYCLVIDEDTSPHTYRMETIDKDGTVSFVTAAYQVTNTAFNSKRMSYDSTPLLYRVGNVDGTGNFRFDLLRANTPNDNNTQPYDGVRLEINTTGSTVNGVAANTITETTDGLIPNNIFIGNSNFNPSTFIGPTDNGIMGAPTSSETDSTQYYPYGTLGNINTGQFNQNVSFGRCPFFMWSGYCKPVPWLGSYFWIPVYQSYASGMGNIERTDMHAFLDELAVYYGLL
tara:strand:- start:319 stop:1341 length:1023 start_codon:yes stop_codon:yes gene_type:complete